MANKRTSILGIPLKPDGKPDFKEIRRLAIEKGQRRFTAEVDAGIPPGKRGGGQNAGRAVASVREWWKRRQNPPLAQFDRWRRWRHKPIDKTLADFWWLIEAGREAPDSREEAAIRNLDVSPADLGRLDKLKETPGKLTDYWRELAAIWTAAREREAKAAQDERGNGLTVQYVTMDQAAAIVSRSKRTLRGYYDRGDMPTPDIEGQGGKPHEWKWERLRPWLQETFKRQLPEVYPSR